MLGCMTAGTTDVLQTRVPHAAARQLDEDAAELGLATRSDAVRAALDLLHRQARQAALARSYDDFYGPGEAPSSDIATLGDQLGAEAIAIHEQAG